MQRSATGSRQWTRACMTDRTRALEAGGRRVGGTPVSIRCDTSGSGSAPSPLAPCWPCCLRLSCPPGRLPAASRQCSARRQTVPPASLLRDALRCCWVHACKSAGSLLAHARCRLLTRRAGAETRMRRASLAVLVVLHASHSSRSALVSIWSSCFQFHRDSRLIPRPSSLGPRSPRSSLPVIARPDAHKPSAHRPRALPAHSPQPTAQLPTAHLSIKRPKPFSTRPSPAHHRSLPSSTAVSQPVSQQPAASSQQPASPSASAQPPSPPCSSPALCSPHPRLPAPSTQPKGTHY